MSADAAWRTALARVIAPNLLETTARIEAPTYLSWPRQSGKTAIEQAIKVATESAVTATRTQIATDIRALIYSPQEAAALIAEGKANQARPRCTPHERRRIMETLTGCVTAPDRDRALDKAEVVARTWFGETDNYSITLHDPVSVASGFSVRFTAEQSLHLP